MIRTFLILQILCLSTFASAQEDVNRTVHYDYDANGNRIRRWVTVEEGPGSYVMALFGAARDVLQKVIIYGSTI